MFIYCYILDIVIVHGLFILKIVSPSVFSQISLTAPSRTLRFSQLFEISKISTNSFTIPPVHRMLKSANNFCSDLDFFLSPNTIKKRLKIQIFTEKFANSSTLLLLIIIIYFFFWFFGLKLGRITLQMCLCCVLFYTLNLKCNLWAFYWLLTCLCFKIKTRK